MRLIKFLDISLFLPHCRVSSDSGQATVEAAIMIPIIFLLMLLLLQPGIILYDRCVMMSAAQEGCRVLATSPGTSVDELVKPYILRRLSAIPQQDNFHVHSSGCSYQIESSGDQNSREVAIKLHNEVKPLPLIGFLSSVLGLLNDNKNFVLEVSASQQTRPSWTSSTPQGKNVESWIGGWL